MEEKKLAEAALFMSPEPITLDALAKIMGIESHGKALQLMDEFVKEFNERESSIEIVKTRDNRYRMHVRHKYVDRVQHLAITTDLSKGVLRTLAIIAYKQPIRQSIIVKVRGTKAYDHVSQLVEEGFVRKTKESNTFRLETTKKFEQYFGPPVKDLDLTPKEAQATLEEAQKTLVEAPQETPAEETGTKEEEATREINPQQAQPE